MKKIFREKGNLNRPTNPLERKFDMRYGLPTLIHRVELAFVQQTKKHTSTRVLVCAEPGTGHRAMAGS